MKLIWTQASLKDVREIGDYIKQHNPVAAFTVTQRIFNACQSLSANPEIGRTGRVPHTRELVVTGTAYIVPYRVLLDRVEILAVFHGARRWPEEFTS